MSKSDDNTPIDNELKAYLAGEDGVSATYRQASSEEPPAELDRLILAAARAAVQRDTVQQSAPHKIHKFRQQLPVAASFMIGVLVTSMYFNREDDFATSEMISAAVQEQFVSPVIELPAAPATVNTAFSPAAPAPPISAAAEQESQPEALARNAPQEYRQATQQTASAGASVAPAPVQNKAVSSEDTAIADDSAGAAQTALTETNAPARERAAQDTTPLADTAVPAVAANRDETRTASDAANTQLEEVTVSGSRIRTDAEFERSYRQNREEWLQEILALGEEAIVEVDQLEEINTQLEEEMALFSEAFPDVDLEAQLQSLEEE